MRRVKTPTLPWPPLDAAIAPLFDGQGWTIYQAGDVAPPGYFGDAAPPAALGPFRDDDITVSVLDPSCAGGAKPNKVTSCKPAFDAAVARLAALGGGVLYVPDTGSGYWLPASVPLASNITVRGGGLIYCPANVSPFTAMAGLTDPAGDWMVNVAIEGMRFEWVTPSSTFVNQMALRACNVRGLRFVGNRSLKGGGLYLTTARRFVGANPYNQNTNSAGVDPAVTAGFSASNTNDLNEDFYVAGNRIDNTQYGIAGIRVEFAKRGLVQGNICRYAAIAGWGGAAIVGQGGEIEMLRRLERVSFVGNYVEYANGAVYLINGESCAVTGNVARMIVDTAFDYEGTFNSAITGNVAINCGNYCYSTFYASRGNVFTGNVGYLDGSAKNINTALGTAQYAPCDGNTFFGLSGTGFTNIDRTKEARVAGNLFIWGGATGAGRVTFHDASFVDFDGNWLLNTIVDGDVNNSGLVKFCRNTLVFDRDVASDLVAIGGCSVFRGAIAEDNTIIIKATQTGGKSALAVRQRSTARDIISDILRNKVIEDGGSIATHIEISGTSTQADRLHVFNVRDNVVKNLVDTSGAQSRAIVGLSGNRTERGDETVTQSAAPTAGGWVAGTKIRAADLTTAAYEAIIAERTGIACGSAWAGSTTYAVGYRCYNGSPSRVYECIAAGASAASGGPTTTSTAITDGGVTWRYLSARVLWRNVGPLN